MKSNVYLSRCQRQLKEWHAPLSGWYCVEVIDIEEEYSNTGLFTCELCGCSRVRFVQVMQQDYYFENVSVGCICAGIMEGDVIAAKERERLMKNRAKRKRNFPKRKWRKITYGMHILKYQGSWIRMTHSKFNQYGISYNGKSIRMYKGQPITNFLTAVYAAFDHVDPLEEILSLEKKDST